MAVVIPFIGAALGSAAAAGTALAAYGASIGWIAGSLLASALNKPPNQQGPRLEDLTITGTDYGQGIPWVAGSPRLAPQYAWVSPLREIANSQKTGKGGGGRVTTYTYECDCLLILSENVTEGVARDWINGELVRNGLVLREDAMTAVTVYTGEDDQLPDPVYEAAVGAAPAYRGRTTILITGLQLGGGKQMPNIEHQITRSNITVDDRIRLLVNWPDASEDDQSLYQIGGPTSSAGGTVGDGEFTADFNTAADNRRVYANSSLNAETGRTPLTYEILVEQLAHASLSQINIAEFAPNGTSLDGVALPVAIAVSGSGVGRRLSFTPQGLDAGSSHPLFYSDSVDFSTYGLCHLAMTVYPDSTASLWVNGNRVRNRVAYTAGLGTGPTARIQLGGSESGTRDATYGYYGARIARAEVYTGASFTPPTTLTGDLANVNAVVTQGVITLDELIEQLLARAGYLPDEYSVDVGLRLKEVHGYATANVTSTRAHLETLRPFGLYEANCSDRLYIFPRAVEPAGVIPWEDLGASETAGDPEDPFPLQVGNEVEVPAQISVRYRNVSADWNVGTEFSDRLVSSMVSTQSVDMPFGLTPTQAKAIADTMLKDAMAGLGRATLRVGGRKHALYEPGDILTTTAPNGTGYRFRIITKRDHIFMIEWEVALDDASALDSPAITETGYISTEDPIRLAPTSWEVIPIRPVRDADATVPGPYVAMAPAKINETDEWPGAVFVRARLPEAFEQQFISGDVCVMGTCQTILGDYSGGSGQVQRTGKLRVRVLGELESADYYDFFTDRTINAAVVGNEPIRFMTAVFVGMDGLYRIYDLFNILRGQLGMESEINGHGSNERFVLLNNSIRRMVNETTDIDAEQQVKAVTLNLLLDSVTDEDFTDDGIALRPVSPVYLSVVAESGDLDFTWIRRSRLVARWTSTGVVAPLGELTEAYRVSVYDDPDADPVRTVTVTSPEWTYTAANLASDGFTAGDPITVTVQQLSDLVGAGDAVTLETAAP